MGKDAARIGIAFIELVGRAWPAAINEIIKIDGEQRRAFPHVGLTPPAGIEFEIGLRNHILPAMVVEFVDCSHALALAC